MFQGGNPFFIITTVIAVIIILVLCAYIYILLHKRSGLFKKNAVKATVLDTISLAVIIVDKDNHLIDMNQTAESLFPALRGISAEQSIAQASPLLMRILSQHMTTEYELNGSFYEARLLVLTDSTETVNGYTICLSDITERHTHTEDLLRMKERAEEANEAKSAFLTNMSHEIRTPMSAIIGMSEIAMQFDMEDELRELVENIYSSGERLLDIINHILDLSKVEAGKIELTEDKYLLHSLLYDVANTILVRLKDKPVVFDTVLDKTIPCGLIGDVVRVKEILLNVLGNAVKYTNEGSIRLTVGWQRTGQAIDLIFKVEDTGIGIKPEDLDKIFGVFYQVDTRRNRTLLGTGLGLAITKNFVELMEGTISVDSNYGEGTIFTITIRQKVYDYMPIGQSQISNVNIDDFHLQQEVLKREFEPYFGSKVLVVDDLKLNLQIVGGLLRPFRIRLEYADNGIDALNMIEKKDYDLVLLDHMMPEMDGVDVVKALRAKQGKRYQELPVVALSANAIHGVRDFFISNGFSDFIEKPIRMRQMLNIFKKLVPNAEERRQRHESGQHSEQDYGFAENESPAGLARVAVGKTPNHIDDSIRPEEWNKCHIEGVQAESGIRNVGGKLSVYRNVLRSFHSEISLFAKELAAYRDSDTDSIRIKLHGIKGSAANIGASAISETSRQLEMAIKEENTDYFYANMDSYLESLDKLLNHIAEYLHQVDRESHPDGAAEAIRNQITPDIAKLFINAIQNMDYSEIFYYTKLIKNNYADEATLELLKSIELLLDQLEYEEAQKLIEDNWMR